MAVEGIIGKKIGMTQVYAEDGRAIPVTVLQAGPCVVVQRQSKEKDGYSRVLKGMRAAGHMGSDRVTARNLTVVRVDADKNILVVKGSVPGAGGSYVVIRKGAGKAGGAAKERKNA